MYKGQLVGHFRQHWTLEWQNVIYHVSPLLFIFQAKRSG